MPLLPAFVTLLSLIMYLGLGWNVGKARVRYGVKAPATTGNEDFERYYRVQMNTLEMMVVFLPSLWIYAIVWPAPVAASAFGLLWIIGRILYAAGYYKEAAKRGLGFGISFFAMIFLLIGALMGVIKNLI